MPSSALPVWVAQRLWLGTLLFAAGAGVLYLCRTIGLTGPGPAVAALAFMFTPYVIAVLGPDLGHLMPWSGLPWMMAFVVLALRRRAGGTRRSSPSSWRWSSGINASSIL